MYLNTKQLIEQLTGSNKAWVTRTENTQREKYGNEDVFGVIINKNNDTITITLGESSGIFRYNQWNNKWERDYGNLYHEEQCTKVVNELAQKFMISNFENTEMCKPGTLREKVADFIEHNEVLCKLYGEEYYCVEDSIVDFIINLNKGGN